MTTATKSVRRKSPKCYRCGSTPKLRCEFCGKSFCGSIYCGSTAVMECRECIVNGDYAG